MDYWHGCRFLKFIGKHMSGIGAQRNTLNSAPL